MQATMSTHRCEECWAVLDPAKILRCTKCKVCFYCSRECQTRNWRRIHKRVCSTEQSLRPFIRVEMAVERVLKKLLPKVQKALKDAFCYICLEGDDGGKLMRGCACRGDSAGFVHVKCLTELAMSKDESGDADTIFDAWNKCGNCKQRFTGALMVEMKRGCWRHHRSRQDHVLDYNSTKSLAGSLGLDGEIDAANQLFDEASTCVGNNQALLVDLKLLRVSWLSENGQKLEALGLLQAMLPEVKAYTTNPHLYVATIHETANILVGLDRSQEAHEAATEAVAFTKAKFGMEDPKTLLAMTLYAEACAELGRVEEAKAIFEDVLATQTRVMGHEHLHTQLTRDTMQEAGFAASSG